MPSQNQPNLYTFLDTRTSTYHLPPGPGAPLNRALPAIPRSAQPQLQPKRETSTHKYPRNSSRPQLHFNAPAPRAGTPPAYLQAHAGKPYTGARLNGPAPHMPQPAGYVRNERAQAPGVVQERERALAQLQGRREKGRGVEVPKGWDPKTRAKGQVPVPVQRQGGQKVQNGKGFSFVEEARMVRGVPSTVPKGRRQQGQAQAQVPAKKQVRVQSAPVKSGWYEDEKAGCCAVM